MNAATNCVICMGTGKAPVSFGKYVDCVCTKPCSPSLSKRAESASDKLRAMFGLTKIGGDA